MTPIRRAAIVAVGSELLTPLRIDTNSLWITEQLNGLGIVVAFKAVAGDDREELAHLLRVALERVDLVVLSGGLGPTDDDVTREVVAAVLRRPLAEDGDVLAHLEARFAARGLAGAMPANNRRQAQVPAGARVIRNEHGSAPGLWIEDDARVVLLLPGPPRELRPMLTGLTAGGLRARAPGVPLRRRIVRLTGRIESQTDEALQPLYAAWARAPVPIAATILSTPGQIELYLSATGDSETAVEAALAAAVEQTVAVLGRDVFSTDGRTLEEVVGGLLVERRLRIALAESCTGGLIASRLTDVPGSSRYVDRAVVSYANEAKTVLLGVAPDLLAAHGAVSEPVARAMAAGIRASAGVDVGVGVTGIAGPGGGSADKPVGTVAIAVAVPDGIHSRLFRFPGERGLVKFQAAQAALDMTRRAVLAWCPPGPPARESS